MIRAIFLFSFFFFFFFTLTIAQKFNAGIVLGLSTSQVDGDHLAGFNHVGVKGGGFVNRKISEKMSMQFELEFIQKGSRQPLNMDNNTYYLLRLNYVEAPLMFSYMFTKKISIEAGASLAVLLSSHEEDQTGIPYNSTFHKDDFLANGGLNYILADHLLANVRYSYSIIPFRRFKDDPAYFYLSGDQYNSVIAFSLAYQF